MPTIQTTQTHDRLMFAAFREVVETECKDMPKWSNILCPHTLTTTQLWEEIVMHQGLGQMTRQTEASGPNFDTRYTPFYKKFYWNIFSVAEEISYDADDTDQSGKLKNFAKEAGKSRYYAREYDAAGIIDNMTNTATDHLGIDGVCLGNASHPIVNGGTFSNLLSTAALLGYDTLDEMLRNHDQQKTYRGTPWLYRGKMDLWCHDVQNDAAMRLYRTSKLPGTADNDENIAGSRLGKVYVLPFMEQRGYSMLVPSSPSENPFFFLDKGSMFYLDQRTLKPSIQRAAYDRWTRGWKKPQGVVCNAGTYAGS